MVTDRLAGRNVLVTRPAAQATDLNDAIRQAGGNPIGFPVLEIVPRPIAALGDESRLLQSADIAVFVSSNAVRHGVAFVSPAARTAVVGPRTAAALREQGRAVDICPSGGFDSEALLQDGAFEDVAGKNVLIVRGNGGRELLAETLRARGAHVDYLTVYERRLPEIDRALRDSVAAMWLAGELHANIVMSIATLHNLLAALPQRVRDDFAAVPLVTPAARVIKEAQKHHPSLTSILAPAPTSDAIVDALAENLDNGPHYD